MLNVFGKTGEHAILISSITLSSEDGKLKRLKQRRKEQRSEILLRLACDLFFGQPVPL
jgi:hypothetical protein